MIKIQKTHKKPILGRSICSKLYAEAETVILNALILMTTPKNDFNLKKAI